MKDYFTLEEKTCHCGCGLNLVDAPENADFLAACNEAREIYGGPIDASSMTRCEKYNDAIGGTKLSAHKDGRALDTPCTNPTDRMMLVQAFMKAGFKRIEVSAVHVHADMKRDAPPVLLVKTERGIR